MVFHGRPWEGGNVWMGGWTEGESRHTQKTPGMDGGGSGGRLFGLTLYIATWLGGRNCFCCIWSVVFGLFLRFRVLAGGGVGGRIHLIFFADFGRLGWVADLFLVAFGSLLSPSFQCVSRAYLLFRVLLAVHHYQLRSVQFLDWRVRLSRDHISNPLLISTPYRPTQPTH